jgi:hypothetical protein
MIIPMVVVLPAPLPPSRPTTSPFATDSEIPLTAIADANDFTKWSRAITGVVESDNMM